jgi:tetratricopeptide (TPR) repeat protein
MKGWLVNGIQGMADAFLSSGQRQRAEEVFDELRALAQRSGNVVTLLASAALDSVLAVMDGRLEDIMDMSERIRTRGEEAGLAGLANMYSNYAAERARVYLGVSLEAREREIRRDPALMPELCLILAHLGRKEEASEILESNVVRRPGIGTAEDMMPAWFDANFLEAAVLVSHRQAAELLLDRLSAPGLCTVRTGQHCIARLLGGAAALLDRYDEARQHYQEAIKICTDMRLRPEMALTHLQLAELLLEHYPKEKAEALEHLDFAINEFREMKMQPSLERALRHKEIMGA